MSHEQIATLYKVCSTNKSSLVGSDRLIELHSEASVHLHLTLKRLFVICLIALEQVEYRVKT